MKNKQYIELLLVFNYYFEQIIEWSNGLKIKCRSFTGIFEPDTEPEDDNYIGQYAAAVHEVKILHKGNDNSVKIYNKCIEITLKNIPEKIFNENGTIIWNRPFELKSL